MIKVSVMYSNRDGSHFDMSYYCARRSPLVCLTNVAVEKGIAGMAPGSPTPFLALGQLYLDSVDAFQEAFTPHATQIVGDIPNYTNSEPTIQISIVKF